MGNELLKKEEQLDDYGKVVALENAQSPEAQSQAVAALGRIGDKYLLPHEGLDAAQTLAEYDRRMKTVDKLDREFFKGDSRAYGRHIAAHANERANRRKALVSAVNAEMKHGMDVAIKNDTERRINSLIEIDSLDAAGVLANQAADGDIASQSLQNGIEQTTTENEFATDRLKEERDAKVADAKTEADKKKAVDEYRARKAAVDTATIATRTAIGYIGIQELAKISKQEEEHARGRATSLRQDLRNIFMQKYKAYLSMNQSHEIAYANALEATRQGSIRYFSERMKGGQVGSVLYTLDELEKTGDELFKASVTDETPTGVYDPSAYGFCRKSDILALRKAAKAQLEEARHDELTRESIANANDNAVLKASVYNAQRLIDKLYSSGEAVKPEDETVLAKNVGKILEDINAIYARNPKVIGAHVNTIKNYYRREQARYVKAMGEASNCQNEEDFRRRLRLLDSTTEPTQKVSVPLLDSNGNVVETEIEMDTHKAFLTTYSLARKAGYFKSGEFAISARRHNDPALRASRIQSAINSFFDTRKSGKTATFAGVVLDVNKDGSIGVVNTKKETVGELDDALKGDVLWFFDSNLKIPYEVIRSVVNRLDDFCVRSMVTPTDDQLKEELKSAYDAAIEAHDNKAFNANFLNALSGNINAKFDPQENYRRYADDQLEVELRRRRGEQVDPALLERVENGRIRADFKVIEASVVPTANMYKRSIMRGTDTKDDNDFMAIAEE